MAGLEAIVLVWWAEKIYRVWSRLYASVVAIQWPWRINNGIEAKDGTEAKATEVAPKRNRRQPAIDTRDVCYKLLMMLLKGPKKKAISCKILFVQGSLNITYRTLYLVQIFFGLLGYST